MAAIPVGELLMRCEQLDEQKKFRESFALLERRFSEGERDTTFLWHFARSCYVMSEGAMTGNDSEQYIDAGLKSINEALTHSSNDYNVYKYYGVLLGRKGEFVSPKEKIGNAYIIRDAFLKSVQLCPTDATSLYCLGKWCYTVTNIGFIERNIASMLFADPPKSSYEDAEKYLLAANQVDPSLIHVNLLLGETYKQMKRTADAKKYFGIAAGIQPSTEKQLKEHAEAESELKKFD